MNKEWDKTLNKLFNDTPIHTNSVESLYVAAKPFKIPKKYVIDYLNKQPDYQVSHKKQTKKNTPTIVRYEPGYLQMDFVNIKSLKSPGITELLNFVDVYTRQAFSFATPGKNKKYVIDSIKKLIVLYPLVKVIQSDNAAEFNEDTKEVTDKPLTDFLKLNNIKQVFSTVATPTSNAYVERFNGSIKKILFAYKQKTGKDPIPDLDSFVEHFNKVKNADTKVEPALALHPDKKETIVENTKMYHVKKNKSIATPLQVGDKVRISLEKFVQDSALKNKIMKEYKNDKPNWSYDIFKVTKVFEPKEDSFTSTFYQINSEGNPPWTWLNNKKFQRHDLLKVVPETDTNRYTPKYNLFDVNEDNLYKVPTGRGRGITKQRPLPKPNPVGRPPKPPTLQVQEQKQPRGRPKNLKVLEIQN